jgi:gamma-tubulin complex component 4
LTGGPFVAADNRLYAVEIFIVSKDLVILDELNVQMTDIFTLILCKMVIAECVILCIMSKISHNVDSLVHLQNCMQILKSEPGPCAGIHQLSSDDGNQVVGIKGEYVDDIKVEEDPGPAASTGVKTEPAVSLCVLVCMCVCTCTCVCVCVFTCVCMDVCMHVCVCVRAWCARFMHLWPHSTNGI